MKADNPTTVRLDESVQKIKEELTPIYGLKNVLSAGLWLFNQLSDTEQKRIIAQLHNLKSVDSEADEIVSGAEADVAKQKQKGRRKSSKAG